MMKLFVYCVFLTAFLTTNFAAGENASMSLEEALEKEISISAEQSLGKVVALAVYFSEAHRDTPPYSLYVGKLKIINNNYVLLREKKDKGKFSLPQKWINKFKLVNPKYTHAFDGAPIMLVVTEEEFIESGYSYVISNNGQWKIESN